MIYTYTSRVRYSEIDETGNMTLVSLIHNLQDCCTFHGEEVGVGLKHNLSCGHGWIVANIQSVIERYPRFGETIDVTTWAENFRGMIAHRNFEIRSQAGELLAEAATDWLFMDIASHKPIRIPEEQSVYGLHPEKPLTLDVGKRKVRVLQEGTCGDAFVIREDHLDTNRHVNNAQYVRLATRYLPAGFTVHRMRAEFKKQAMLDDLIVPRFTAADEGVCYVSLLDKDGEEFFTAEFKA